MTNRICPACGNLSLHPLDGAKLDHCSSCGASVPKKDAIGQYCPKCHNQFYGVEDHGDVSFFVHKRDPDGKGGWLNIGCAVPTERLGGFATAEERLRGARS